MNKKIINHCLMLLTLPMLMLPACDDGSDIHDDDLNERASLTKVELVSAQDVYLMHPVKVAVAVDISGEAFSTELLVGMRSSDREEGCVLGSVPVEHDLDGEAQFEQEAEFQVDSTCYNLVGRDDVELFVSFDPWNRLGEHSNEQVAEDTFGRALAASLDMSECESCEELVMHESPGVDPQLRGLTLGSTIAVLSPEDEASGRPDLSMSSELRVPGLKKDNPLDDGTVAMQYSLRPLGSHEQGLPLLTNNHGELEQRSDVTVPGYASVNKIDALYIQGATREAVTVGEWAGVEEFEIVSCIDTQLPQARYLDGSEGESNDCATMPVVILQDTDDSQLGAGAGTARETGGWGDTWGHSNGTFGTTQLRFDSWMDAGATTTGAETYSGKNVAGMGAWVDTGTLARATVFDLGVDLFDWGAALVASENGGLASVHGRFMGFEFMPTVDINVEDGTTFTLTEILASVGFNQDTIIGRSLTLAGYDFDDGCGTVTAAISLVGEVGLDSDSSNITFGTNPTRVDSLVVPTAAIMAVAETSVSYGEFLEGGVSIALDLIRANMLITGSTSLNTSVQPNRVDSTSQGVLDLSTLSGVVTYWLRYDTFFGTAVHNGTLLSWNGFHLGTFNMFNTSKSIDLPLGGTDDIDAAGPNAAWQLTLTRHDKCLDLSAGNTSDGANLQQWDCNGANSNPNQHFKFVPSSNGYYYIKHATSGKCLDVQSVSSNNGANIQLYGCGGGHNQQFAVVPNDTTADTSDFVLKARHSGKCIDLSTGNAANGTNIQQWVCDSNNTNQNFALRERAY